MEPLGKLLQRVTTDSLRTSQSVDAVGASGERRHPLRYQHAEALLQLLRNAVLARDWPRAAALASVGLQATSACTLPHEKAMQRHSDASFQLMQLATEVCRQCGVPFHGDLEAAAHRQTRKRAKLRRNALVAEAEGMQWAAALAVHKGDLDSARLVAARAKNHAAAALIAYAKWAAASAAVTPANAASTQRVALQLRTAALPLLKEAAAASPEDELLKGALACIAGPRRGPIPGQEEEEAEEEEEQ